MTYDKSANQDHNCPTFLDSGPLDHLFVLARENFVKSLDGLLIKKNHFQKVKNSKTLALHKKPHMPYKETN